jgi:hypothetical protein
MRLITTNGVLPMDGALPAQMRLMTMFFFMHCRVRLQAKDPCA